MVSVVNVFADALYLRIDSRLLKPARIRAQPAARNCTATPQAIAQGEVVRVSCTSAQTARMNGRTVRLFPQPNGAPLGLMPVPVLEKPGAYSLELLNPSGAVIESLSVRVTDAHYQKQDVAIGKSTADLKPSPGEHETVDSFRETASPIRYWTDNMQLPVPGCLTSPFGAQRLFNGQPTGDFHAGLDQRGAQGKPIHAVAAGVVKIVSNFNLRGGTVAIDHGQGVESIYMHMSRTAATQGRQVAAGDVIGYVGATGRANGPHLHWTLYVNGVPVNPAQWVKVPASCAAAHPAAKKKKHVPA